LDLPIDPNSIITDADEKTIQKNIRNAMQDEQLSPAEILFAIEYAKDLNASRAFREVFGVKKNAQVQGPALAKKPGIGRVIREFLLDRAKRSEILGQRTLEEVIGVAFAKLTDVASWDAEGNITLKDSSLLTPDQAASIKKVTRTPKGEVKIELHDKLKAAETLLKCVGFFSDGFNITDSNVQVNVIQGYETDANGKVIPILRKAKMDSEPKKEESEPDEEDDIFS
jgi:phage terminase small subunit